uniref:maturase K n=1 Tax=Pyrrosia adnascens TaxID=872850 RepID=UPI0026E3296E|nr:maturase K [Pyrrosia adnascens]YP_010889816.1 maturase K [Pyrrosia hastata]WJJ69577.1 maturase K [Pyrrosia adnascens]WJJ69664.1 maturase K [Pyrrosia hastata]
MRINSGSSFRFEALHRTEEIIYNNDCFPYLLLLLFRDNFYSVACKFCLDKQNVGLLFKTFSAVATKRLIDSVRYQNYSEIFDSEFVRKRSTQLTVDLYLHVLLQTICLILGIPHLHQLAAETNNNLKISQSIHSLLLFFEDRLPKSSHVLEIEISQNVHLETLVRLFRRRVGDVSFLHILRIGSYTYKTLYGKFTQFRLRKQKKRVDVDLLLQNFYAYQIDSISLILWSRKPKFQSRHYADLDTKNIYIKRSSLLKSNSQLDGVDVNDYLIRSFCIHFGRYRNKSFIAFQGAHYFVKRWINYLFIFLRSHFNSPTELTQIRINLLSTNCLSFLGYILAIQLVSKNIQIETTASSCNSISSGRITCPRLPILLLVKLLQKEKFCDSTGCPISKVAWVVLTDDDILNRFGEIWNIFYLYYGAATNQDELRKLRYILRLSCDSTLASKHRSTIRLLRRRFDLELPKVVHAYSKLNSLKRNERVWRLNLIRSVLSTFIPLTIQIR